MDFIQSPIFSEGDPFSIECIGFTEVCINDCDMVPPPPPDDLFLDE